MARARQSGQVSAQPEAASCNLNLQFSVPVGRRHGGSTRISGFEEHLVPVSHWHCQWHRLPYSDRDSESPGPAGCCHWQCQSKARAVPLAVTLQLELEVELQACQ